MQKQCKISAFLMGFLVMAGIMAGQKLYSQPPGGDGVTFGRGGMQGNKVEGYSLQEKVDIETRWMKKYIKLKKEQLDTVKSINLKYELKKQDIEKAWKQTSQNAMPSSTTAKQDKLNGLDKEKEDELKTVFTPEQFDNYIKKKIELSEILNPNQSSMPPPGGGF